MQFKSILLGLAVVCATADPAAIARSHHASSDGDITVDGTVANVCVGKRTGVTMKIHHLSGNEYQAVGAYDGKSLFGRFDVPGKIVNRGADFVCLQFRGEIELGGSDGSGWPAGTKTSYVMSVWFTAKKAEGVYHIGPLRGYEYEQYGTMQLDAHHEMPGATAKMAAGYVPL